MSIEYRKDHLDKTRPVSWDDIKELYRELALAQLDARREFELMTKRLGELGNKWGGFTEGMAYPSMQKVLSEHFNLKLFSSNVKNRKNGRCMEIDVLGYANSEVNTVCVVEVKSYLREDGLQQLLKTLRHFTEFFPEHKDKEVYGILAAVDIPEKLIQRVSDKGIYLARISDETFSLQLPPDFIPYSFGKNPKSVEVREKARVYKL